MPSFEGRGFPLYFEVTPPPAGAGVRVPLVHIMGMGGSCQGWSIVTLPVQSLERGTVIFDNRGVGRSAAASADFTLDDLVEDTRALLAHLGIERAHVIGGFLGGLVGQELAVRHPDLVQSLILLGSFAKLDAKRRAIVELWKGMVEAGVPWELRLKGRLIWTLGDETMEQADLVRAMSEFFSEDEPPVPDEVFIRQAEICLDYDGRTRLKSVAAPTLVITGEQDILTPERLQRELAHLIPKSRLVLMHGAGHLVAGELAPRFNRLLSRFLSAHE